MNITVAENSGFCFGVKKAIDEVNKLLSDNLEVYCIGDIIHNENVVDKLKNKGLKFIYDKNDIIKLHDKNVVIRSHGIEKNLYNELKINNNNIYDLTCPYVKKIHNIVDEDTTGGIPLIIIGDKNHPEVIAIKSYAKGHVYIIDDESEICNIKEDIESPIILVNQTTIDVSKYKNIVDILAEIFYNIKVYNTICINTINRQEEAAKLSKNSDIVFIIGSKKSSNTKKLYDICSKYTESYLIENKKDIDIKILKNKNKLGIIAGASTPDELIEEIVSYAKSNI